jgi:hypothetical protein
MPDRPLSEWLQVHGEKASPAKVRVLEQEVQRQHDRAEYAEGEWGKAKARVQVLEEALKEAADTVQDLLGYVSPFFIEKWGYDKDLAKARAVLASEGTPEEAS